MSNRHFVILLLGIIFLTTGFYGCHEHKITSDEVKAEAQLQDIGQRMFLIAANEGNIGHANSNVRTLIELVKKEKGSNFSFVLPGASLLFNVNISLWRHPEPKKPMCSLKYTRKSISHFIVFWSDDRLTNYLDERLFVAAIKGETFVTYSETTK